jgi:hypothetical protein
MRGESSSDPDSADLRFDAMTFCSSASVALMDAAALIVADLLTRIGLSGTAMA